MDSGTSVGRRGFLSGMVGTTAVAGMAEAGQAAIDPDLNDRSGRVTGMVRLTTNGVADIGNRSSSGDVIRELKHHAAKTQRRLVDYVAQTPGIEIRRQFWLANAVLVTIDTELASLVDLAGLDQVDRIHRVEADRAAPEIESAATTTQQTEQDSEFSYGLEMMHVPEVWERFDTRGDGSRIAVLDTGVDPSHPDIDLTGWAEFDAEGNRVDSEPHDPQGHGTGMSGLATGGNASGTHIGVAPAADLLVARFDQSDVFTSSLAALEWAVENDADAVSMSFDIGPLKHESIEAVSNANAAGTVVVSTGFGPETFLSTGSQYSVLSAGAVDRNRTPYNGGNGGEIRTKRFWRSDTVPDSWPDRYVVPTVVTAGVDVLSAVPDNDEYDGGHVREDGYSNGPPHIAGVVALLRSIDSGLTPERIKQIIQETAEQPGEPYEYAEANGDFGHGIANAAAAAAEVGGRGQTISGTVTDTDGEPVRSVTVTAVTGDSAETDDSGRYTLAVPDGPATVRASKSGYEPITQRVAPGDSGDISFPSEVRPDIQLATQPPTHVSPGETLTLAFDIAHAEFITLSARESPLLVDSSAVSARINGDQVPMNEPVEVPGDTTPLRVALTIEPGTRGVLPLSILVAADDRNAGIGLDPIHVHERPMEVIEDHSLQNAIDIAAPETTIRLAGDRWERTVEPFDPPLPDGRYGNPVINSTRGDAAGFVIDKPLTITPAAGHDPTIVATGGEGDRTFGVQIAGHFTTLEDIEVVSEGSMGAVSVVASDGVHLRNLSLSGATNGVYAQFTKSLVVRSSTITASEAGVTLRDFSVNALVDGNTIRDSETGVFLSGRVGERLFDVDATITGNTFEDVSENIDTEGTTTVTDGDGTTRQVGGEPPGDSMLDMILYAATATTIGALFYPYARRRLGAGR